MCNDTILTKTHANELLHVSLSKKQKFIENPPVQGQIKG